MKKRFRAGFTLIEVMVVISIIGILSSVVILNVRESGAQGRDAERQANLREVQSALELYKLKNGRYPSGCRAALSWSGQVGTSYACTSGNQYIVGLAPEFISTLPQDPKLNGTNSGYVYVTNAQGTAYKFMAKNTVESLTVTNTHEFKSCDVGPSNISICNASYGGNSGNLNSWCATTDTQFQTSFAVWGGRPIETNGDDRNLEAVICDVQ